MEVNWVRQHPMIGNKTLNENTILTSSQPPTKITQGAIWETKHKSKLELPHRYRRTDWMGSTGLEGLNERCQQLVWRV